MRKKPKGELSLLSVDLNCDLGESFGAYKMGNDEEVLKFISSANIACGFHAGDPSVMKKTVKLARKLGVAIGAHPGLPDLSGFGRREMNIKPEDIYNLMVYQIGALQAVATTEKTNVVHVKPHGALYNMAAKDRAIADAIAAAIHDVNSNLVLFGLAGSELVKAGLEFGLKVSQEVFADRTYEPDGTLTHRSKPNAMIHNEQIAIEQVLQMVLQKKVTTTSGKIIAIQADTICVHGDGDQALQFVKVLKEKLQENSVQIRPSWSV